VYIPIDKIIEKYQIPVSGVIHIGAHFGEEYLNYIQQGIYNLHFFEASRRTFLKLRSMVGCSSCYNFALGAVESMAVLHVETRNEGQSNSLLKPLLHTKQYPQIVFNETEEVQVYPLDSFQIEGCNFLNIDVQGFELEVLKGSKKTLRGVNYIYSEVNRAETYENCAQIGDMDEFLLFNGFKRVETIWSGGIWGDALWIRE
jgi:FkbM family methyltransferase